MSLFGGLDVSASALTAQRLRMDVTAENLANAETTRAANGQPYRRKEVVLQSAQTNGFATALAAATGGATGAGGSQQAGGVEVAQIAQDNSPPRMVYDPGSPDSNTQGYVAMPNVNTVTEMTDMITATRAYEANATAIQAVKGEAQHALDILR